MPYSQNFEIKEKLVFKILDENYAIWVLGKKILGVGFEDGGVEYFGEFVAGAVEPVMDGVWFCQDMGFVSFDFFGFSKGEEEEGKEEMLVKRRK